jgi:phosphoribosylcarboxyaminoimidazole (NCAIR) mutase
MPPGVPVATVSVGTGGAKNAAVLAARILALKHPEVKKRLSLYTQEMAGRLASEAEKLEKG